ncbi:hypothetical protein ACFDTO_32545 [Microbacteriaceae bacterium 4G12]
MKVKVYACLVATCILFAGCSNNSEKTNTKPKQDSSATQQEKKDTNSVTLDQVTLDQFSKVKSDMTYEEVKKIMGSEGAMKFEKGEKGTATYSVEYFWEIKDPKSLARVTFLGGKVRGKSQEGLQ